MYWKTVAGQVAVAILLAGLTGGITSSIAAFFFGDHPFAISLTALPYRVIVLTVALVFGWNEGGRLLEMHLWIAAAASINFLLIRRAAVWLYPPQLSN